jgi:hypothetical protein
MSNKALFKMLLFENKFSAFVNVEVFFNKNKFYSSFGNIRKKFGLVSRDPEKVACIQSLFLSP